MLEGISFMTRNLTTLQCRVVAASYFQFSIRPLQAWNFISQALRDCMHMLSSSFPKTLDDDSREFCTESSGRAQFSFSKSSHTCLGFGTF